MFGRAVTRVLRVELALFATVLAEVTAVAKRGCVWLAWALGFSSKPPRSCATIAEFDGPASAASRSPDSIGTGLGGAKPFIVSLRAPRAGRRSAGGCALYSIAACGMVDALLLGASAEARNGAIASVSRPLSGMFLVNSAKLGSTTWFAGLLCVGLSSCVVVVGATASGGVERGFVCGCVSRK